jgi:maltooligosyltrehalose trehalohydrolase
MPADPMTAKGFPVLGAIPGADGTTLFHVWAPSAESVAVEIGGTAYELARGDDDVFTGEHPARPGDDYVYVLDGEHRLPDPASRFQPEGLRGPSRVVAFPHHPHGDEPDWAGLTLEDLVIYELHVGTFSPEGTFDGVIPRLAELRDLGVTAIEIMPVATFAGDHGWGYDGVYLYAPHPAYGGPDGLHRLVEAAHRHGIGVILDVVYNHLGAGSDAVSRFGPLFSDRGEPTIWGEAIDYTKRPVREWAIQNAEMWVRDYDIDGLRLDAVHSIFDDSPVHVMTELAERVKAVNERALLIDEMEIGDLRPIREWHHDAQWEDALHHAIHVLLTDEHEGYYAEYGTLEHVARELTRPEKRRFVVCDQNHDQVGNRALGDRLRGADLRLAATLVMLSPGTPMLFQGEEYDESHPFQYFTDHIDPEIARLTRDGRRREFSEFSDFEAEDIPDPQDPETFLRSKLDPSAGDPAHLAYYRRLLALRRELGDARAEVEVDEARKVLTMRRGPVTVVANFADAEQDGVAPRSADIRQ